MKRNLIVYIAMSLDGFIAATDDNLDFLATVEKEGEDYGYAAFVETIDTVIVGRRTYDKVISMGYDFPHADKEAYVITRTARPAIGSVQFFTGDLKLLVEKLKAKEGKNIYCDGGAQIVNTLLEGRLFDEFIISVIPVLLGTGIRLFDHIPQQQNLELISVKKFETGLVQLHYTLVRH